MIEQLKRPWLIGGLIVVVLTSVACIQVAPRFVPGLTRSLSGGDVSTTEGLIDEAAPVPMAAAAQATPDTSGRTAIVRLGSIAQTVPLSGRVAGADEVAVAFPRSGKVRTLSAKLGDKVGEGQVLLETDAQDITKQLSAAQAELDATNIRLEQAQAQVAADSDARSRDAAQRAQDDASRRQAVVLDAQGALHQAQTQLDLVKAGASQNDIRAAQAAVRDAQLASQRAESDQARLESGPDENTVRIAERDVADAQTQLDKAQADLDRLTAGADPDAVRAVDRDVERAQSSLRVAQAIKLDPKADEKVKADRDAAIAVAQLSLQDAQDRAARLKKPAADADVVIAKRNLQIAQSGLAAAKQRLVIAKQGPSPDDLDRAATGVDNAHLIQQNAEQRLADLQSQPTRAALQAAQDKVTAAQAALTRAQALGTGSTPQGQTVSDVSAGYNMVLLQKDIARSQAMVDSYQQDLNATKLAAPFAGVITGMQVRPGDLLDPGSVVLFMSTKTEPVIRLELSDKEAAQLALGQTASVQLDGADGDPLNATLSKLTPSASVNGRIIAEFAVRWNSKAPSFGTHAALDVTTMKKDNVLVVPKKAVRSAGQRRYVQYQDGTTRKIANVEIGITTSDTVEILSGLTEGQIVTVNP